MDISRLNRSPFDDPKPVSKKKTTKKPVTGKKQKDTKKALPEKKIICPYCKTVNTFPEYKVTRYCSECGKVYFRPGI
jgi:uncharacterized CHY-type Zn-finger protein